MTITSSPRNAKGASLVVPLNAATFNNCSTMLPNSAAYSGLVIL